MDIKRSLRIPDNLFVTLIPIEDNTNKIILFLKNVDINIPI